MLCSPRCTCAADTLCHTYNVTHTHCFNTRGAQAQVTPRHGHVSVQALQFINIHCSSMNLTAQSKCRAHYVHACNRLHVLYAQSRVSLSSPALLQRCCTRCLSNALCLCYTLAAQQASPGHRTRSRTSRLPSSTCLSTHAGWRPHAPHACLRDGMYTHPDTRTPSCMHAPDWYTHLVLARSHLGARQ